jgi:hypothetical protein
MLIEAIAVSACVAGVTVSCVLILASIVKA